MTVYENPMLGVTGEGRQIWLQAPDVKLLEATGTVLHQKPFSMFSTCLDCVMLWRGGNHPPLKITFYTIFMSITQDDTDGLPKPHARNVSKRGRGKDSKTNKRKKTTMAAA